MDNHPIPQDVTGFKFRLIGSMTVKQFLYILGAGALCGAIFIMPISFLIKWPAIITIASIGASLAFLPIEGRPMDVMLVNFLKALPAENRYLFHKMGAGALIHDFFIPQEQKALAARPETSNKINRRELLLNQLVRKNATYKIDEDEKEKMTQINSFFQDDDIQPANLPPVKEEVEVIDLPTVQSSPPPVAPTDKPDSETVSDIPLPEITTPPPTSDPKEEIGDISIPSVKPQNEEASQNSSGSEKIETPVRVVTPETQIQSGFPQIPDTPNVILGIVKDARGRVLPNILVEVVDENKNPVRAFKTNALGQFASVTPLPDGKYQVLLEDNKQIHEFPPIDIEMVGEIFQPLEIISTDQREKLRQELFGSTAPGN